MMKKENLLLVIGFVLMLVLSIVLVSVQTLLPQTPVEKMFGRKVEIQNEVPVISSEYINIHTKSDVVSGNEKLADLYIVRVDHVYFYMELYVAINENGKVFAIDKQIDAKDATSEGYLQLVRQYLLKNYNGLYYENVQYVDGFAGATTIEVSRAIIKNAISQVIIFHNGKPVDYIEQLFNSDNYENVSSETISGIEITKTIFNNENLTVYKNTGKGSFYDHSKTQNSSITILVALNDAGVIKYVDIPTDKYEHSGGSFYNQTLAFLEGMIGSNISDDIPDGTTGPTEKSNGSQFLVNQLMNEIKGVA